MKIKVFLVVPTFCSWPLDHFHTAADFDGNYLTAEDWNRETGVEMFSNVQAAMKALETYESGQYKLVEATLEYEA